MSYEQNNPVHVQRFEPKVYESDMSSDYGILSSYVRMVPAENGSWVHHEDYAAAKAALAEAWEKVDWLIERARTGLDVRCIEGERDAAIARIAELEAEFKTKTGETK